MLAWSIPASLQTLAINTNIPEQKDKEQVYVFTASEYERVEETTAGGDNIYSPLAALASESECNYQPIIL